MEQFERVEVDSVTDFTVAEVAQQASGPMSGPGVDPLEIEARDSGVAGAWHQGCPTMTYSWRRRAPGVCCRG